MLIYCILLYMFLSMLNGVLQVPLRQPDGDVQTEATEAIKFLWWTGRGSWRMDENGRPWTFAFLSCRFTSPWKLLCNLHELKKIIHNPYWIYWPYSFDQIIWDQQSSIQLHRWISYVRGDVLGSCGTEFPWKGQSRVLSFFLPWGCMVCQTGTHHTSSYIHATSHSD